jgi:hypothetical protein
MTRPTLCRPRLRKLLAAALLLPIALPALAQYQWRDESGRMIFSDQPPPASVKPTQILRAQPLPPGSAASTASPAPSAASRQPGVAGRSPQDRADAELDRKRQAQEKEAADKLAAQKAEQSARLARDCEMVRGELRTLDSGMRMARINAGGEREYLNDDERSQRSATLNRDLAEYCK